MWWSHEYLRKIYWISLLQGVPKVVWILFGSLGARNGWKWRGSEIIILPFLATTFSQSVYIASHKWTSKYSTHLNMSTEVWRDWYDIEQNSRGVNNVINMLGKCGKLSSVSTWETPDKFVRVRNSHVTLMPWKVPYNL